MKRSALVIKRERVKRGVHDWRQLAVTEEQRPDEQIAGAIQLPDRHAVGLDRIPQPEEMNARSARGALDRLVRLAPLNAIADAEKEIAQRSRDPNDRTAAMKALPPVGAIRFRCVAIKLGLGAKGDEALAGNEAREHADR